jgi:hypothetical protein
MICFEILSGKTFDYTDTKTYENLKGKDIFNEIQINCNVDLIQLLNKLYDIHNKLCSIVHVDKEYPEEQEIDMISSKKDFILLLELSGFDNDEIKAIDNLISFKEISLILFYKL